MTKVEDLQCWKTLLLGKIHVTSGQLNKTGINKNQLYKVNHLCITKKRAPTYLVYKLRCVFNWDFKGFFSFIKSVWIQLGF